MAENYDNGDKDRRELLKLKQGLVDEKDSNIKETGYDVRMAQTPGEKTKNFLWYHKVMIVVGILLIALAAVIYAEFFVKKKPDITIYSLGITLCPSARDLKKECRLILRTLITTASIT